MIVVLMEIWSSLGSGVNLCRMLIYIPLIADTMLQQRRTMVPFLLLPYMMDVDQFT